MSVKTASTIENLKTYFGDRVIVEELPLDEKMANGLVRPANRTENKDRNAHWKARVVAFGLDSRASEAYDIKVGDLVYIEPTFKDIDPFFENGKKYLRVPDEYVAAKVS